MEQEIIIETEMSINYDIFKKYYLFSLFKGKSYKIKLTLFYGLGIFSLIVALISGFRRGFDINNVFILTIWGIFFSLITFLIVSLRVFLPKKQYEKNRKVLERTVKYKFTQDYIYTEASSEEVSGSSKFKYEALYKVCEVEDMIYIY